MGQIFGWFEWRKARRMTEDTIEGQYGDITCRGLSGCQFLHINFKASFRRIELPDDMENFQSLFGHDLYRLLGSRRLEALFMPSPN
jgi:hypothetical protein